MNKFKRHYLIFLDKKNPQIYNYEPKDIQQDLKYFKLKDPIELSDYDMKVFRSEVAAEKWLNKFKKILKGLSNKKVCLSKEIPTILYKRRYIVQTLMGEKLQTYRRKPRVIKMMSKVKLGDMFNLNDQKYFLTVILTSVSKDKKGEYKYKFRLPREVARRFK